MKAIMVLCMALVGCANDQVFLPDGSQGHNLNCSGMFGNWGTCYKMASDRCGARGYEVVAGGSEPGNMMMANQGSWFASSNTMRTMLIKCKN